MTELDQVWSQMLADAGEKADAAGRQHVAEYLRLRATNDAMRGRGVRWLIDTFIEMAADQQRGNSQIVIEREEPYSFSRGSSRMKGTLLVIRQGVRCLTIEAGWVRMPGDGIMRGGALAVARLSHFGKPGDTAELRLVHSGPLPTWLDGDGMVIDTFLLRGHFDTFLEI